MQEVIKNLLSEMEKAMEEDHMAAILKRFGDEQSTLLDKYERLSFEVQLDKAMFGRSLSEPAVGRRRPPPQLVAKPVRHRRGSSFQKLVKKILRPFLGRKDGASDAKDHPIFCKAFSRSVRI